MVKNFKKMVGFIGKGLQIALLGRWKLENVIWHFKINNIPYFPYLLATICMCIDWYRLKEKMSG